MDRASPCDIAPLQAAAAALEPELVALRRAIHADPELGLHTPRTTNRILAALFGLPLSFASGPSTTGFVARLDGAKPGPTVLLRADIDALPLNEDTGLPFASKAPGVMHACGHDAHAAMLVGAAKLLCARRELIAGSVVFMFQPGEEGYFGARHMMADGLLDPFPDAAFALHVAPTLRGGGVFGRAGSLLASADTFEICVEGRGGHASTPHDALDPIPIACEIVLGLQSHIGRRVPVHDPAVLTIGCIEAGSAANVIPEMARLRGSLRTLSPEVRVAVKRAIPRIAGGIAAAHGASAAVAFEEGFPSTICDPHAVALGAKTAERLFGAGTWSTLSAPFMNSEDFSFVLERCPGAMFMLGAAADGVEDPAACCGLHSNRMVLDEAVLRRGAALHTALAETFLSEGFPD